MRRTSAEFMADLRRPSQRVAAATSGESDSDGEDERRHDSANSEEDEGDEGGGATHSRRASHRRSQQHHRRRSSAKKEARADGGQKSRKAFYSADGTATVAVPALLQQPSSSRSRSAVTAPSLDDHPSSDFDGQVTVAEAAVVTASQVTDPDQIPFASPVFVLDREARLQPSDFWRLWKQAETTCVRLPVVVSASPAVWLSDNRGAAISLVPLC